MKSEGGLTVGSFRVVICVMVVIGLLGVVGGKKYTAE